MGEGEKQDSNASEPSDDSLRALAGRLNKASTPPMGTRMSLAELGDAAADAAEERRRRRLKLIVIHGWGGSFLDAIEGIEQLLRFRAAYRNGTFIVQKRDGLVLRRLFMVTDADVYVSAFQKLAVARLLAACFEEPMPDCKDVYEFSERRLINDFGHLGIPVGPQARHHRATLLEVEALAELEPLMPVIAELKETIRSSDGTIATEVEAREMIEELSEGSNVDTDLLTLMESLRAMHETGGDVDTVHSAVLYAHWLIEEGKQHGRQLVYGRDYRFVFVNYHESFLHLAEYGPADVYMADLPIGALPDFDEQVYMLRDQDIAFKRFEDHHPYTQEQIEMLERLKAERMIEFLAMSGPLVDSELEDEELKCAADMVYESCVQGTEWDGHGPRNLRAIGHSEDFVTDRSEQGRAITELIKGGICKIELAQTLLAAQQPDQIDDMLRNTGWRELIQGWHDSFRQIEDEMWQSVVRFTVKRPQGVLADTGGQALGPGSDVPAPPPEEGKDRLNILVIHAYRPAPGSPKVPVGKATEFFAAECPDADYLFYCYGSSLLVSRRLNQADLSINLGALMPRLGGDGDGGHAGAAVCRPDANEHYPHGMLGRVDHAMFVPFCSYLASRLTELGLEVVETTNLSRCNDGRDVARSTRQLLAVTLGAVAVGVVAMIASPDLRPGSVAESNADFYPQLEAPADEPGGDGDDDAGPAKSDE
jgi:hypothetical protein